MIHWVSFIIGVSSLLFINELQARSWLTFFIVFLTILFLLRTVISFQSKKNHYLAILSWINWLFYSASLVAVVIFFAYQIANKQISHRLSHHFDGEKIWVTGRITKLVKQQLTNPSAHSSELTRFNFSVIDIDTDTTTSPIDSTMPRTIKVVAYFDFPAQLNDIWRIKLRIKKPEEIANLNFFDYQMFALSQGFDALATMSINSPAERRYSGQAGSLITFFNSTHDRLSKVIKNLSHAALIKALVIGRRDEISSSNNYLLRRVGVSHLLAISGMHIGVAVLLTSSMTYLFLMSAPTIMTRYARTTALIFTALPLAFFYSLISGFSIPTQRALLMFLMLNLFVMLRRRVSSLNAFFLLAAGLLALKPMLILSSAFCLSFFATFILLYYYNGQQFRANDATATTSSARLIFYYCRSFLQALLLVQCILFLAMPTILSLYAGHISLLSPLANVIAVPVVTLFTVPAGLIALMISYISIDVSFYIFNLMNISLDLLLYFFNSINDWSATTKLTYFQWIIYLEKHTLVSFIISIICLLVILTRPLMPGFVPALICLLILMNSINLSLRHSSNKLMTNDINLTQFYVGQGLSILIETNDSTILYDTGPKVLGVTAAASILLPYATRKNIMKLDHVIISHGDDDHASGINFINSYFEVGQWWLGGSAYHELQKAQQVSSRDGIDNIIRCFNGQKFFVDNLTLDFINPPEQSHTQLSENDASCVLLIRVDSDPKSNILLTGDISKRVEKNLMQFSYLPKIYMMSAPHHGSKTSSSYGFIRTLDPVYVLISAGHLSRYKHPNKAVVERYMSNNTEIIRSDQLGTIQFRYRNGEWYGPFCIKYKPRHIWQSADNTDTCYERLN